MGEPSTLRLKVRHYEVDEYGHVNHTNYVHYLEVARIEALEAVGLSLAEMRRQGYLIFAADLSVKYRAPAHPGETLEIVTFIREIRGARSIWMQEIREAATQRLLVSAEVTGAFMTEGGRPVRAPVSFIEKLSTLYVPEASSPRATGSVASLDLSEQSSSSRPWCLCRGGGVAVVMARLRRRTELPGNR